MKGQITWPENEYCLECCGKLLSCHFSIIWVSVHFCFSQSSIKGIVKDGIDATAVFANVILKDSTGRIITYSVTENDGGFVLKTDKEGPLFLQISSLTHQNKRIDIDVMDGNDYDFKVFLNRKTVTLDEVVVHGKRYITV